MSEKEEIRDTRIFEFDNEMSCDKARDPERTIKRLIVYLMKQKWKLLFVFISTVAAAVRMHNGTMKTSQETHTFCTDIYLPFAK